MGTCLDLDLTQNYYSQNNGGRGSRILLTSLSFWARSTNQLYSNLFFFFVYNDFNEIFLVYILYNEYYIYACCLVHVHFSSGMIPIGLRRDCQSDLKVWSIPGFLGLDGSLKLSNRIEFEPYIIWPHWGKWDLCTGLTGNQLFYLLCGCCNFPLFKIFFKILFMNTMWAIVVNLDRLGQILTSPTNKKNIYRCPTQPELHVGMPKSNFEPRWNPNCQTGE